MQQSMTGYGRDERTFKNFLIKSEVKTLNSKFLDFTPRYGKEFAVKESDIRNLISDLLKRGKIMLSIELSLTEAEDTDVRVDEALFKAYYKKFKSLATEVGQNENNLFELALQAPEVLLQQEFDAEEIPWDQVMESLKATCSQCSTFRSEEGSVLEGKLEEYISNISEGLKNIEQSDDGRSAEIRNKLKKNLDDIRDKVQVDDNRFEQELIYYLEKIDITEEIVRLRQHLNYFIDVLKKEEQSGKKLGFIAQEIGREINTIGSKANHVEIQQTVVVMKDDLEKIKEQVLNLL